MGTAEEEGEYEGDDGKQQQQGGGPGLAEGGLGVSASALRLLSDDRLREIEAMGDSAAAAAAAAAAATAAATPKKVQQQRRLTLLADDDPML
jgi:hypothetical protein